MTCERKRPLSRKNLLKLLGRARKVGPQRPTLRPTQTIFPDNVTRAATVKSWDSKFVGNIPTALHGTLREYMKRTGLYARAVSHVQSSGTGKSRAHDELAKRVLYIPLNLAGPHATSALPDHILLSLAQFACLSVSAA